MVKVPQPASEPAPPDDIPDIENEVSEDFPQSPVPPSHKSLLLDMPLYQPIALETPRDDDWLSSLRFEGIQFDAHCVYCKQESIFRTFRSEPPEDVRRARNVVVNVGSIAARTTLNRLVYGPGQFGAHLACQRAGHIYSYYFMFDGTHLAKIGQTPSIEDVAGADVEKYRKMLGDDFSEMRKAGGLISHGIGIGAFVYLRRIFERLIEDARAESDPQDDGRASFYQLRMSERVDALKGVLPAAVVEYKNAYGILSKGLHELTEEECKRHFPVVRAAIIAMLEERYEADQKRRAAQDLKRAVADAATAIQQGAKAAKGQS